jgi:phage shock protein C
MEKRLYRSRNNRMLAGICGGLGQYFGVDPTVVRIIAVICLLLFTFVTFLAYLILILIIPLEESASSRGPV